MDTPIRRISHPGAPAADRIQYVAGHAEKFEFMLEPGFSILESIRRGLAAHGYEDAVLELDGGSFRPFVYVIPSLSRTPEHAVWYSDIYRPEGETTLDQATVTFGVRDGEAFLHCHALWTEADGKKLAGHVIPHDAMVSAPIRAQAWGMAGMRFQVDKDNETNFSLFQPRARDATEHTPAQVTEKRFYAMRLRPNQDFCFALEDFCDEHGINTAVVRGGVGSVIGALFEDGHVVDPIATELLVRDGHVTRDERGRALAHMDVVLVDYEAGLAEGVLVRGRNPVLVTVELLLEKTS
jgi:predicted DNA-binding protein with PD1-like motif